MQLYWDRGASPWKPRTPMALAASCFSIQARTAPSCCHPYTAPNAPCTNTDAIRGLCIYHAQATSLGFAAQSCNHAAPMQSDLASVALSSSKCISSWFAGSEAQESKHGLLTTIGYQLGPDEAPQYALEGSIAIGGAGVSWLRDQMGLIGSAEESEAIASSVNNTAGKQDVSLSSYLCSRSDMFCNVRQPMHMMVHQLLPLNVCGQGRTVMAWLGSAMNTKHSVHFTMFPAECLLGCSQLTDQQCISPAYVVTTGIPKGGNKSTVLTGLPVN